MTARILGPIGITPESTSQTTMIAAGRTLPLSGSIATEGVYVGSHVRTTRAINSSAAIAVPPTNVVVLQQTTYYKLRGWDPLTRAFETWVSTTAESAAPSGHTLVGREISAKWVV